MNDLSRRRALQGGAALLASSLLPAARACEFFAPTLRVIHPWTQATAPDATSVLVSMRFDDVNQDDRLVAVETPVAESAELRVGERAVPLPFDIPAGRETRLGEEGTQLRLTGLREPLHLGRAYPMTLHFEKGGVVPASLSIDYPRFS